jgi:hypothetical protein
VFVLKNYSSAQFINIGVGEDLTIAEFARTVAEVKVSPREGLAKAYGGFLTDAVRAR